MDINNINTLNKIKKVVRYFTIYGISRTIAKIRGRARFLQTWSFPFKPVKQDTVVIGCGQFGFSTIAFFLKRKFGNRVLSAIDIDEHKAKSFYNTYNTKFFGTSCNEILDSDPVKYVFIASNHASHSDYAIQAIEKDLIVYVEKPICVSHEQFSCLLKAIRKYKPKIYAGYNRPFSKAMLKLSELINIEPSSSFSISCYVSGHDIPNDHWYRKPEEGTRICGNVGHWIDLIIHLLSKRGLPDYFEINITYSDCKTPDDNLVISMSTEGGDIASIMISSRTEPFEGINESIDMQYGDIIAKIDDFRSMTVWHREYKKKYRYWPKDVGHERAIMQPFEDLKVREWSEVENSTLLMLFIKNMVISNETERHFSFSKEWDNINNSLNSFES